jgi:hypothetical protein
MKMPPKSEDYFIKSHFIHFNIFLSKKEINQIYTRERSKELENDLKTTKGLAGLNIDFHSKKEKNEAMVLIEFFFEDSIARKNVNEIMKKIQMHLDPLQNKMKTKIPVHSVSYITFRPSKYKSVIPLPLDIPIKAELTKEVGKPRLVGIDLDFEESPVQASRVSITTERKWIIVNIMLRQNYKSILEILCKSADQAVTIANMFVEEK